MTLFINPTARQVLALCALCVGAQFFLPISVTAPQWLVAIFSLPILVSLIWLQHRSDKTLAEMQAFEDLVI